MTVEIERDGEFAIVRLNRPEKHNGVDMAMLHGVVGAARSLRRDRRLRGVILAGNGPSFCAGLDVASVLKDRRAMLLAYLRMFSPVANLFQRWGLDWRRLPVPVIACVHGACFGAGIQLAMAADFRFVTPDAKLSIMESKWGLVPDMTAALTLRGMVPEAVAKELTMTGRVISAEDALELGIVGRVVEDPVAEARSLLEEIATRSPDAVAGAKALFQRTHTTGTWRTLLAERLTQARVMGGRNQMIAVKNNRKKETAPYAPRRFM